MQQKKKENYVKVCPQCKSTDVSSDKSTIQQLGQIPIRYICNNCKHSGFVFPEVLESKLEEFEKEIKKTFLVNTQKDNTPLIDDSYGKYEVRVGWKIYSLLNIVAGIILLTETMAGIIFLLIGLIMAYFAFFKKRKLKE